MVVLVTYLENRINAVVMSSPVKILILKQSHCTGFLLHMISIIIINIT